MEVRGVPVALQPSRTCLLIFLTLGLRIFAVFAIPAEPILRPLYAICDGGLLLNC